MSAVGLAIGSVAFILCLAMAVSIDKVIPSTVGDVTLFKIGLVFLGFVAFGVGGADK